jgi:hypothetical protein
VPYTINILKDDLFKNKRNYKKPGERREWGRNLKIKEIFTKTCI